MKRILGIDYGKKRIGLAVSDPNQRMALPWKTIQGFESVKRSAQNLMQEIQKSDYTFEKIIIGNPLQMSGKPSEMTAVIQQLVIILKEKLDIEIILWDERLSSLHADKSLKELNLSRKKRSQKLDEVAATLLLQNYLDSK